MCPGDKAKPSAKFENNKMNSRNQASGRRRRKTITYIWIAVLSLIVITLIHWEQTALLYILATLGVTALLIIVALADLHGNTPPAENSRTDNPPGENKIRSTFGGVS